MAFRINSRDIKEAFCIQVTFIMQKKLQKVHFLAKKHCLLGKLYVHFEFLLGWQCTEYKVSNWHTSDLHHGTEV